MFGHGGTTTAPATRRLVPALLGLLLLIGTACGSASPEAVGELYLIDAYDPDRDPRADLEESVAALAGTDRRVLAIVGGDWCPDCWNLDDFIDDHPAIHDSLLDRYGLIKVNSSEENPNLDFLSNYPSFAWFPYLIIFDADGDYAESVDTRILMRDGRFDADAFNEFLDR